MDEHEEVAARLVETARERRLGVRAAGQGLEQASASAAAGRAEEWGALVAERLAKLGEAWGYHIEITEASDGLFNEIVDQAPRLAHRVEGLRADHVVVRDLIDDTAKRLQSGPLDDEAIAAIRDGVLDLLQRTARHRHTGADIVYEAFNVDMEGGD